MDILDYRVSTEKRFIDFEVVYQFISGSSYWAKGITREVLQKALDHSLCFSLVDKDDRLVGFARLITDHATFAYLADVFVIEACRGQGLGKMIMDVVMQHPDTQHLRRMLLATRDAHTLYEQYGFTPVSNPENFMQVWKPDVYSNSEVR